MQKRGGTVGGKDISISSIDEKAEMINDTLMSENDHLDMFDQRHIISKHEVEARNAYTG